MPASPELLDARGRIGEVKILLERESEHLAQADALGLFPFRVRQLDDV